MPSNSPNPRKRLALTILAGFVCGALTMAASPDGVERGRAAFENRCTGCHALDRTKAGPPLRGVYGRTAGKDPAFVYSDALKKASVTWDVQTLDRWLADTDSVIPDNDMAFRLDDPGERASIIAYLKQLPGK